MDETVTQAGVDMPGNSFPEAVCASERSLLDTDERSALRDSAGSAMVDRNCPLCGSTDDSRTYAATRRVHLIQCVGCGLVYASPVPTPEALARAYTDTAFNAADESRFAARTYGYYLKDFLDDLPNLNGALDIGAGDGAFLQELVKLGFDNVVGVEPSAAATSVARADVREFIRQDVFRASDYKPGTFSLITCFQTIECVPDPAGLIAEAHQLLKPGGALLMVCHNLNALTARLFRLRSPIFHVEHLQLFTPSTASQLLRRTGFEAIEVYGIVNAYPLHCYLKMLPLPRALKHPLVRTAMRGRVARSPIPAPLGNLCAVGFRAPDASGAAS